MKQARCRRNAKTGVLPVFLRGESKPRGLRRDVQATEAFGAQTMEGFRGKYKLYAAFGEEICKFQVASGEEGGLAFRDYL